MRSGSTAPGAVRPAAGVIAPVEARPHPSPREGLRGSRSFADLLAEAEAVRDTVEIHRRTPARGWRGGVQGALQGAAGLLARQAPWLALPLLLRRPAQPPTPRDRAD